MKQILAAVLKFLKDNGIEAAIAFLYQESQEPHVCIVLPGVKKDDIN